MKIIQSIMTKNPCYTTGQKITVKGLMLHSIGCPQPSAQKIIDYWNSPDYDHACVHGFIDGNTGDVYQTLPWNHRGWHGGGTSNNTHIGVEMCEPACIKYTPNSAYFTCSDTAQAKAVAQRTYDSAVLLFAHLCKQFNLDPLQKNVVISHKEGHRLGIASNHGDPEHIWQQLGLGYTMDTFRKAVKAAMEENTAEQTNVIYRVQVGAFSKKANAEAMLAKAKAAGFKDAFIATSSTTTPKTEKTEPEITFKVGDKVKLASNAVVYGTTTQFASWVYKSTLYVRQVDGNKIVVSTQKTGAVTGAVDKKYLTKL